MSNGIYYDGENQNFSRAQYFSMLLPHPPPISFVVNIFYDDIKVPFVVL